MSKTLKISGNYTIDSDGSISIDPGASNRVVICGDSITIDTTRTVSSAVGIAGDVAGMFAWSASFVYICSGPYDGSTEIWRRVAVSTW